MGDVTKEQMIQAIYGQESSSGKADTSKENYAGARGPMQVTRDTFAGMQRNGMIPVDWRHDNPTHTKAAGETLVGSLFDKYQGDPSKVAAAYYAGEKAVRADGTINDFKDRKNPKAPTTLQYVSQVLGRMGAGSSTAQVATSSPEVEITPEGQDPMTRTPAN
jgi:Transglycosylase SLT domain